MLKIKLQDAHKHRNETTFRPYVNARRLFHDIGVKFVFSDEDRGDIAFIGQATFVDKNRRYDLTHSGMKLKLRKYINPDYIVIDGQDSASLMGTYDGLIRYGPQLMLKNTLYADESAYSTPSIHGRIYWKSAAEYPNLVLRTEKRGKWDKLENYSVSEYDYAIAQPDLSNIHLSGANWLSTLSPHWFDSVPKDIDVFALFSFPAKYNTEWKRPTNYFYDAHRSNCISWLKQLPATVRVAMLDAGNKVPIEQYYELMRRSKIVVAPFGYGEIAPRDLESAMVGAVLAKPDMGHIKTIPNPYIPNETYRPVKWDFSDLNDVILDTLSNYKYYQDKLVTNFRQFYNREYSPEKLVVRTHELLSSLKCIGTI